MKRTVAAVMLAVAAQAADLPVKQVILYKNGVGYFERSGRLGPGESARLDFKASEMNDVLKSLTVEALGGGQITGLRYDSSEPVGRKLAEFPFKLGDAQPLSAVLDQLKGARVELRFGGETVSGALVGARVSPGDAQRAEREQVSLLLDNGDLRVFDLAAATSVRFTDPQLQARFKDYLAALVGARSEERRSVYIDSADARARDITAGYMAPVPVWKSSYRLIFGATGPAMLEGWAIVDNTSGEDWTKVQISLVSGRPISFVSRLYEPRYLERQTAELPEERAYAPVVHEGAVARDEAAGAAAAKAAPPPAPRPAPMMERVRVGGVPQRSMASSIAASAAALELGELFEYRIAAPVTVRKSESVMLPFLQQKVSARKLLIYADLNSRHPMNAAEIVNDSGKTLDGGPITVYDGGAYGGEALVETVKNADKRLISYAIDLGTRITTHFDSKGETVRELHARRGLLTTRTAAVETRTYTVNNVDQKAKTLIIEHAARPGYTLLERKPGERTSNAYRFEVKLAAGGSEKFPVTEERVYESTVALASATPDLLLVYTRNKNLSDAARKQLEEVAARKREIAAADQEIRQAETQANETARDQERLRQNIDSLNRVSGQQQQVQVYARQLAAQESTLAALRDKLAEQRKRKAGLEESLARLIESLEF